MRRQTHHARTQRLGTSCDHLRRVAFDDDKNTRSSSASTPNVAAPKGAQAGGVLVRTCDADRLQLCAEAFRDDAGSGHRLEREL